MMHGSKRLRLALLMTFALRVFAQTDHVQLQLARLQDADAVVRTVAVTALGQFRDARAVDPLLAALKDPDESVRMTTAYSLHGFRAAREVPALIAALDDSSETVSQAAAMTLGDLKDPRAIPALMNGLSTHRGNEFGLTQMGGAAVPALVGGLHSDDPTVRQRVAEVLGMIRDPRAETPLLAATHDPVAAVRAAVCVALSYFPDARTADALLAASKDPDASVRGVVVRMMTRWKDPRGFEALIAATQDLNHGVRMSAWGALGQSGDERAVAPLIEAMKSDDVGIRAIAVGALARSHPPAAIPALMEEYRGSTDRNTRIRALEGLGVPGNEAVTGLLISALADKDGGIRLTAAQSLGKTKDARGVKALAAGLADPSNLSKEPFYNALASMGPAAFEPLLAQVQDSRSCPRAAGYLAATHDPRAVPELIALLGTPYAGPDGPSFVRVATPAEVEEAAARAHEVTGTCFFAAASALTELKDTRVVGPLVKSLQTPNSGRDEASRLLSRFGPALLDAMIGLFHDNDPETRRLAALTIADMPEALMSVEQRTKLEAALGQALREENLAVLAGDYRYYVLRGEPGSEDALAQALERFSGAMEAQSMAETFLTCGDVQLEDAAFQWGRERHFPMKPSIHGIVWGGRRL